MSQQPESSSPVVAPDGRSTREAELEELRRQQISKSNAQRLDTAPAPMVNLQDWQLQQKALRERERQSKTESAAILHSYRSKEEMTKSQLASIRDQDRRGKADAERFLHSYRAKDIPVVKKAGATGTRQVGSAAVVTAHGTAEAPMGGAESVASLAAGFSHQESEEQHGQGISVVARAGFGHQESEEPQEQGSSSVARETDMTANNDDTSDVNRAGMTVAAESQDAEPSSPEGSSESGIMVETPRSRQEDEPAAAESNVNTSTDGWVAVETSDAPMDEVAKMEAERSLPETLPMDLTAVPKKVSDVTVTGVGESSGAPVTASNEEVLSVPAPMETSNDVPPLADEPVVSVTDAPSVPSAAPMRLDVGFSFGLVSSDFFPNIDKYMLAVADVLNSRFADPSAPVFYRSEFVPNVRDVEEDSSFVAPPGGMSVKRCIVYASVPMFVTSHGGTNIAGVCASVRDALRLAIQEGSFLAIAQRH